MLRLPSTLALLPRKVAAPIGQSQQFSCPYLHLWLIRYSYVILLYTQPDNFTAPDGFNTPNIGVSVFNLTDYVSSSNLGPIVAVSALSVFPETDMC